MEGAGLPPRLTLIINVVSRLSWVRVALYADAAIIQPQE